MKMAKWASINDWLIKEEDVLSSPMDPAAGQPPSDVNPAGMPGAGAGGFPIPNQSAIPSPMDTKAPPMEATPPDPESPDMPEEKSQVNFEQWKAAFFRDSIKGDVNELIEKIQKVRNDDFDSYQRKFVEDNLQLLFLRQNANIEKASQGIRKKVREELDRNNPSVSIVNHMTSELQSMPELTKIFVKMLGLYSTKGDAHRKYLASLLGAVQVGSGGQNEDIILNQKDFSIKISTRMNAKFGMIDMGRWSMTKDDQEDYLSESELERLEDGSPEERDILRKRIMIESISSYFKKRAFIVNVVNTDGTVFYIGLDFSNAIREAYNSGKLIIKTSVNDSSEAMYNTDGELVQIMDLKIMYEKDTGKTDAEGKPEKEELEFITRREGMLFLNASLEVLKETSSAFQGIIIKETPYTGNPSDLMALTRCVPSITETLLRNC
jgi:hypothetical protein